jgi:hypothetical protein
MFRRSTPSGLTEGGMQPACCHQPCRDLCRRRFQHADRVMGGCHARLQEVVLGGVAHATLAPITVPVFMSH